MMPKYVNLLQVYGKSGFHDGVVTYLSTEDKDTSGCLSSNTGRRYALLVLTVPSLKTFCWLHVFFSKYKHSFLTAYVSLH